MYQIVHNSVKIFLISLALVYILPAQNNSDLNSLIINTRQTLYEANDRFVESGMITARSMFERILAKDENAWIAHYYIALADDYLSNFYYNNKDKMAASIDDGLMHLEKCIESNTKCADAHALLSSLYGKKMGLDASSVSELSMKSSTAINRAEELDSSNPRIYLINGRSLYYTPVNYGGGTEKAKVELKKALSHYSTYKLPSPEYPDWGYDETYAWLGQIAAQEDSIDLAESYYKKALEINPQNGFVKYRLLPMLRYLSVPVIIPSGGEFRQGKSIRVLLSHEDNRCELRYTLDGSDPQKDSHKYKDEIIIDKPVLLKAKAFLQDKKESNIVKAEYKNSSEHPSIKSLNRLQKGLTYCYYEGKWEKLPDFDSIKLLTSGILRTFETSPKQRPNNFGLHFAGYLYLEKSGSYTFYLESDDGSKLYIGDKLIIDNDGVHAQREKSYCLSLEQGYHPISVNYFQSGGGEFLEVAYEGPEIKKQEIPSSVLYCKK